MRLINTLSLIFLIIPHILTDELICVVEITRHGARTAKTFTSKVLSDIFGNEMILTPNGFRQHVLLGQYIKSKYIDDLKFLKPTYNSDQFEIYTTPLQRTISSALGFISGLYPNSVIKMSYQDNKTQFISNDTIPIENYTPKHNLVEVPIQVLSDKNDIFHRSNCKYKGEKLKNKVQSERQDIFDISNSNLTECAVELGKFMNVDPSHSDDIDNGVYLNQLEKYLQSFLYHYGKTLDDTMLNQEFSKAIKMKMINQKFGFRLSDSKFIRMLTSELFQMILGKFEQSIINPLQRKLFAYLSHDTALMNVFTNLIKSEDLRHYAILALNNQTIYEMLFPPYASVMLFELYHSKHTNHYYVNINLNGKSIDKGYKYVPDYKIDASGNIPFEDFKFMMNQLIEKDTEKLVCNGESISKKKDSNIDYSSMVIKGNDIVKKNYTRNFLKQIRK